MVRIIVAGGRDFGNYELLCRTLDEFGENFTVIAGGARGADFLGEKYAKERNLELIVYAAEWEKYGKSAGILRNISMAKNADCLVAFWDGKSRGTKHMIEEASKRNLKVRVVHY